MRRLGSLRPCHGPDDERGSSAVIVALLGTVLLGFAAISVDAGRLYWEKAQLQSGADTAAISIASACGESPLDPACTDYQKTARSLANASANDGLVQVPPVALNKATGTVTATTEAAETGGPALGRVSVFFAQVLDPSFADGVAVSATATAKWGAPVESTSTVPLAFPVCGVDATATANGKLWFVPTRGIIGEGLNGCDEGFGWLQPGSYDTCPVSTAVDTWAPSATYFEWMKSCTSQLSKWEKELRAGKRVVVLVPVFDDEGSKGYRIRSYAAFEVRGWVFAHAGPTYLTADAQEVVAKVSFGGIGAGGFVGRFVRHVFTNVDATIGDGPSTIGANVVILSK